MPVKSSNPLAINDNLADYTIVRNYLDSNQTEEINAGVSELVNEYWFKLLKLIKAGDRSRLNERVQRATDEMMDAMKRYIEDEMEKFVLDSFERNWNVFANVLPDDLWEYFHESDEDLAEAKLLPWEAAKKRIDITKLARLKALPGIKTRKPSKEDYPDKDEIKEIIKSDAWKSRLDRWSKKITDKDKVADIISAGLAKQLTQDEIAKKIMPHVQGIASSARRIVRTEAARVANEMAEKQFEQYGDFILGYQIVAVLDDATRPKHRERDKTKYFKKPKSGQKAAHARPKLPDEPNCRCTYTAIFDTSKTKIDAAKAGVIKLKQLSEAELIALTPEQVASLPPGKKKLYDSMIAKIKKKYGGTLPTPGAISGNPPSSIPTAGAGKLMKMFLPENIIGKNPKHKKEIADAVQALVDSHPKVNDYIKGSILHNGPLTIKQVDSKYTYGIALGDVSYSGVPGSIYIPQKHVMTIGNYYPIHSGSKLNVGGFSATTGHDGLVHHEVGHLVHHGIWHKEPGSEKEWMDVWDDVEKMPGGVKKNVSGYAKTNEKELFAESFSVYMHPDYDGTQLPPSVHKYMEKYLGPKPIKLKPIPTAPPKPILSAKGLKIAKLSPQEILALPPDIISQLPPAKKAKFIQKYTKIAGKPPVLVGSTGGTNPAPVGIGTKAGFLDDGKKSWEKVANVKGLKVAKLTPAQVLTMPQYLVDALPPKKKDKYIKLYNKHAKTHGIAPYAGGSGGITTGGSKKFIGEVKAATHDAKFFNDNLSKGPSANVHRHEDYESVAKKLRNKGIITNKEDLQKQVTWPNKAAKEDIQRLQSYTGMKYAVVNSECWNKPRSQWDENTKKYVKSIDAIVDTVGPLKEPIRVFRGTGSHKSEKHAAIIQSMQTAIEQGGYWEEKGIVSTSTSSGTAMGFSKGHPPIVLEIKAKTGVFAAHQSLHSSESEFIQKAGTKYRPTRMFKQKINGSERIVVQCEEL